MNNKQEINTIILKGDFMQNYSLNETVFLFNALFTLIIHKYR